MEISGGPVFLSTWRRSIASLNFPSLIRVRAYCLSVLELSRDDRDRCPLFSAKLHTLIGLQRSSRTSERTGDSAEAIEADCWTATKAGSIRVFSASLPGD